MAFLFFQSDELSFEEGDILYVSSGSVSDPDWLRAKCGVRSGLIPSNYGKQSNITY